MLKTRDRQVIALVAAVAAASSLFFAKNTDFLVYWVGIRDFLRGAKPLYGPNSGIGYPQEFQYPPVTVLLFLPITWLPVRVASFCWEVIAWAACAWAAITAVTKWKLRFTAAGGALGLVILAQFIGLAVKFGNVQPHLIALVFLALLWSDERPGWSGVALGVAICIKVWPLFFAPWFLIRRRRAALPYAAAATAALWFVPVLFFGWHRYEGLAREFFTHVVAVASSPESIWYAGQSLRGVLFRFLTTASPPRDGYPDVRFASLPPALVSGCYMLIGIAVYGFALMRMWRAPESRRWIWDAASFVLFSILQPFAPNSGLISLFPGVLAAAAVYSAPEGEYPKAARVWLLAACGFALIADATFYRPLQREALMLGIDFWLMLALAAALFIAANSPLFSERDRQPAVIR